MIKEQESFDKLTEITILKIKNVQTQRHGSAYNEKLCDLALKK